MTRNLKITGVGPAPDKTMELYFGRRLNLFTGVNGLIFNAFYHVKLK